MKRVVWKQNNRECIGAEGARDGPQTMYFSGESRAAPWRSGHFQRGGQDRKGEPYTKGVRWKQIPSKQIPPNKEQLSRTP